jgi:hypothetical protein
LKRFNLYTILGLAIFTVACSTKKNSFVSRNWHALNTKYNVMHNGNVAFESGKDALVESFFDDYWEILPVERMEVSEELVLPGQAKDPNFERAEEKAVKAIQRHSMNIAGKEKNPQIDESYLLLGKARYFDQRFVPAKEAFNYILYKYPESDKINLAKIWREKTNIRLDYNELAIKNLKKLIEREDLKKEDLAEAAAMMAQAYINIKTLDSALNQIKIASKHTKNNEQRGRYAFIKGQLYNRLGHKDSANMAFDEVLKLKRQTLRIYYINAQVAKIRNFDYDKGDKVLLFELLTKLEEDRENRPYLDIIYNQVGDYHLKNDSTALAELYYNKSLRSDSKSKYLQSLNYRTIGAMKFDDALYKDAGAYFDSTLLQLKQNSKDYRRIKKKRDNLDEVIYYEDEAQLTDSLLTLLALSEEERVAYFEAHIAAIKEREAAAAEQKKQALFQNQFATAKGGKDKKDAGVFYFYSQTVVSYGQNEFRKIWGDIPLEDNWRRSNKEVIATVAKGDSLVAGAAAENKNIYEVDYYIAQLPQGEKARDSIRKKRDYAYYQLGLIYKEKFKELELAASRLESLLANNPQERLVLPAKYQLFKIYSEINTLRAEQVKREIITNYGDSRYAQILKNPTERLSVDENSPEVIYTKVYRMFQNQDYAEVISECEKYIFAFTGEAIVPKFEFLKVIALGRFEGFVPYKKGINFIALTYPNSEEGKKAKAINTKTIAALEKKDFIAKADGTKFKLIYQFSAKDPKAAALQAKLKVAIKDMYMTAKKVSKDIYDKDLTFVVVHGFDSESSARGYSNLVKNSKKYKVQDPSLIISSDNYKVIQVHKNLDEYKKTL